MGCCECKLKENDLSLDKFEEANFSHISMQESFRDIRLESQISLENQAKELNQPKTLNPIPFRLRSVSTTKITNLESAFICNSPLFSERSLTPRTALLSDIKSRTFDTYPTEARITLG